MTARATTVEDRNADRQEFIEATTAAQVAARTASDAVMAQTARLAARTPATVADLRPVTSALNLLREYGGTAPEPLREAHTLIHKAREITESAPMLPTRQAARLVLTNADPEKAIQSAAKARAVERARAEIAAELHAAAVDEVVAAFRMHADEIADAILGSTVLASAFEEVSAAVAHVPASAEIVPRLDDLVLVSAVAGLRIAVGPFEKALRSLIAAGLVTNPGLRGAGHLLYLDPTDADPTAAYRAVRGVRPGAFDANVYTVSAMTAPHSSPISASGVPAAIAVNGTPGMRLALATTVEEFEARVAHVYRGVGSDVITEGDLA